MRHSPRKALSSRDILLVLGIGLSALFILGALFAANLHWSASLPGGGLFFSLWGGSRGLFLRGENPYDFRVALAAQDLADGALTTSGADAFWFGLPLYLIPTLIPIAAISDPTAARAAWALLSQFSFAGAMVLTSNLIDWRGPRVYLIGVTALAAFSLYPLLAILNGTTAIVLILVYCGVLWAMRERHDELAGALCILTLHKWEVGLPFVILLAWRVLHEKRWRVLAGLGMTASILIAISFLLDPGWPLSFLTSTVGIIRSPHGISSLSALRTLWPEQASGVSTGLTVVLLATLVYEWAVGRSADFRHFVWMAFLALAATPLLGMRTDLANLVVLAPCLLLVSAAAIERQRAGIWLLVPFLIAALAMPWMIAWSGLGLGSTKTEALLLLLLPGACVLGMYWTRWWFLRPARTWLDEVRAGKI